MTKGVPTETPGIRQRSPGHYQLRAYNRATGKTVTRTVVGGKREVKAALVKLQAEIAEGKYGGSGATLGWLLDDWLSTAVSLKRSPNTLHGYRAKVRRLQSYPIAALAMAKVTPYDVHRLYTTLRAEGMTSATLLAHHRVLRAALNHALALEWVSRNVATLAKLEAATPPEMAMPSMEQVRTMAERADRTASPDFGAIVAFAAVTGARRGELCGLQWADIDWQAATVTFRRSVWQVRSSWGLKDTKSHRVRTIALDPIGLTLLRARQSRAEAASEMATGRYLAPDAYVWSTQADGHAPRTPNSLSRAFIRLCRTLEAETGRPWPFHFHSLRHFAATQMIGHGVDVKTAANRLGHADASVTLRVYTQALVERDREAAALLGNVFGPLALPTAD